MSALVSIIVPVFNAAPWIRETLDSALRQTHPDIEIIVVDDGSTDESVAEARLYQGERLNIVTQANGGAAAARNRGLRLARGDFIQFLDADDLLSPTKIEAQLKLLNAHPVGTLATCRWGRFENDPRHTVFADQDLFRDYIPADWMRCHMAKARMMHPAAWLAPKAVIDAAGDWDETLSLNDDGEYFARVVLASRGIVCATSPEVSTYYRTGLRNSLSRRRSPAAMKSLFHSAELITAHVSKAGNIVGDQALADYWLHVAYELYPDAPALSRAAEAQSRDWGGSTVPPPLGRRAQNLARLTGWRFARRLALRR